MDDNRLLLRRQRSAREADGILPPDFDPYRVSVDRNFPLILSLIIVGLLSLVLLAALAVSKSGLTIILPIVLVLLGILIIAVLATRKTR